MQLSEESSPCTASENLSALTWAEICSIAHTLTYVSQPLRRIAKRVVEKHRLGRRGVHILLLIDGGQSVHPTGIAKHFNVARSIITEEVGRLTKAGLITSHLCERDRRRFKLGVTRRGKAIALAVRDELEQLIKDRFASYSRDEVLRLSRMLQEFISGNSLST